MRSSREQHEQHQPLSQQPPFPSPGSTLRAQLAEASRERARLERLLSERDAALAVAHRELASMQSRASNHHEMQDRYTAMSDELALLQSSLARSEQIRRDQLAYVQMLHEQLAFLQRGSSMAPLLQSPSAHTKIAGGNSSSEEHSQAFFDAPQHPLNGAAAHSHRGGSPTKQRVDETLGHFQQQQQQQLDTSLSSQPPHAQVSDVSLHPHHEWEQKEPPQRQQQQRQQEDNYKSDWRQPQGAYQHYEEAARDTGSYQEGFVQQQERSDFVPSSSRTAAAQRQAASALATHSSRRDHSAAAASSASSKKKQSQPLPVPASASFSRPTSASFAQAASAASLRAAAPTAAVASQRRPSSGSTKKQPTTARQSHESSTRSSRAATPSRTASTAAFRSSSTTRAAR